MSDSSQPSTHDAQPFTYGLVPLHSASDEIRLIKLLPPEPTNPPNVSREEPLKCRIYSASLQSPPSFKALSYAWGTSNKPRQLNIQAYSVGVHDSPPFTQLEITSSLDEALRYIRQPSETVTLWIDQICINQSNTSEKGDQVTVMDKIYGCASQTLIWLGMGTDDSHIFTKKMEEVGNLARREGIERFFYRSQREKNEFWAFMDGVTSDRPSDYDNLLMRASEVLFDGTINKEKLAVELRAWFNRPWFTRVWVLQEYALSGNATFVCGEQRIDSELFALAYTVLEMLGAAYCRSYEMEQNDETTQRDRTMQLTLSNAIINTPMGALSKLRGHCRNNRAGENTDYTLYELVRDIYSTNRPQVFSSDPRDRIYAC
jgi:hypothetical protein